VEWETPLKSLWLTLLPEIYTSGDWVNLANARAFVLSYRARSRRGDESKSSFCCAGCRRTAMNCFGVYT
jgi:hypothetical protein